MIRKLVSAALAVLLLAGLAGCAADWGTGMTEEVEDSKEDIRQELGELWDAFLEKAGEWSESFDWGAGMMEELEEHKEGIRQELGELWDRFLEEARGWSESFAACFSHSADFKTDSGKLRAGHI